MSEGAMNSSLSLIDKQIMWSRLIAVVEEQAQALQRTAFSTIVRESGDLAAGVGRLGEETRALHLALLGKERADAVDEPPARRDEIPGAAKQRGL